MAQLLELAELQDIIPSFRGNPFLGEEDDHQIKRALAGANALGCKIPELVELRLEKIANNITEIKRATTQMSNPFDFARQAKNPATPSYALAASRHAPKPTNTANPPPQIFRPVLNKRPPPPAPVSL